MPFAVRVSSGSVDSGQLATTEPTWPVGFGSGLSNNLHYRWRDTNGNRSCGRDRPVAAAPVCQHLTNSCRGSPVV